eukprot:7381004-Prymnesium_polylepis.2
MRHVTSVALTGGSRKLTWRVDALTAGLWPFLCAGSSSSTDSPRVTSTASGRRAACACSCLREPE